MYVNLSDFLHVLCISVCMQWLAKPKTHENFCGSTLRSSTGVSNTHNLKIQITTHSYSVSI